MSIAMAGKKIKLDTEAIREFLVADSDMTATHATVRGTLHDQSE